MTDELNKIGVKCLVKQEAPLNLVDLIPVFHRWIQTSALPGTLIDVADYSHVYQGPGVMIIAHDGNYGFDEAGGEHGMLYYAKHAVPGTPAERLLQIAKRTIAAGLLLAQEPDLGAGLDYSQGLEIFANDRLLAPNSDAAWQSLEPLVKQLADRLYPEGYELSRLSSEARERLAASVIPAQPVTLQQLAQRLD